ncbi:sensor histidine kinase [Hymenobacter persicinus]|uniref:Oxygen sensor histidine kinase NreB n=1 Tax=Hymenobacter persicinus TaxID=2025506 RepID=A0A4Q5LBJ9_9BACT|nr:sensor histidine kinase [Hymenobacter persicinus]RYU76727.1 sensor histidine kinase [Hymenobacter persicinus]
MDKPSEVEFARLLFGGIAMMLLLAVVIVLIMITAQRKAYQQQMRLQQVLLAHQKEMTKSVIGSQESERERITRDLHDEIGASLSVVKLFINQIKYDTAEADVAKLAEQASDVVAETVKSIRDIVQNLSPANINRLGLLKAVQILLARLEATGIRVQAALDPVEELGEARQLALYRIVQEILGNIVKHAGATAVEVNLERHAATLLLSVRDNGRGFDLTADGPTEGSGMGLGGMKARAGLLNGQLTVESASGLGTHVTLHLPL